MLRINHKITLSLALLLALSAAAAFVGKDEERTWRVIGVVPETIVRDTIDTPTYYIVRQTHEPFFRCDDLQNYTSKVISKWHRSVDSRKFVFYPAPGLKFNREEPFTREIFEAQLSSVTARLGAAFKFSSRPDSVEVEFQSPQRQYLYFLTWYENAPAIRRGSVEYGLGDFYISSFGPDKVELERKQRVSNGYNKILYLNYSGENDPNLQDRRVQDFNLLSSYQQPEWIRQEYAGVKNPDPRSIVLLINHPDRKTREALYNCVSASRFRRGFIPKRKEFYDIETVLPVGIPAARPGLPRQACSRGPGSPPLEAVLINQRGDNSESLPPYLKELREETGIKVKIKKMGQEELARLINDRHREPFSYNMLEIMLDTFRPDYRVFFEYTSGEKSVLDFHPRETEELFSRLLKADDFESQSKIAAQLAEKQGLEAMVLPLYQTYSVIYYPKRIKNIVVGKSFTQYPEIAEFRW